MLAKSVGYMGCTSGQIDKHSTGGVGKTTKLPLVAMAILLDMALTRMSVCGVGVSEVIVSSIGSVKGEGAMTNYELRCERCDRPAEIMSRKVGRLKTGHETIKKTSANTCACGGKIVPTIE